MPEGMKDFLRFPKAGLWATNLNAQATLAEGLLERRDLTLKTISDLEGALVEFYGCYSAYERKELLANSSPEQRNKLEQAERRMKAVRKAAREAYEAKREQVRREAQVDPAHLAYLDEKRQERYRREEKYADIGT